MTTCTADKRNATILTDNMIGAGVHINAIGGDCPGKTELARDILLRSGIFVEYAPQTRIEGEIQQLDEDYPVTELWQVVAGKARGRRDARQITLFDGVGFAIEDFSALRYIRDQLPRTGHYVNLDLLADPDDPRDLFGMLCAPGPGPRPESGSGAKCEIGIAAGSGRADQYDGPARILAHADAAAGFVQRLCDVDDFRPCRP